MFWGRLTPPQSPWEGPQVTNFDQCLHIVLIIWNQIALLTSHLNTLKNKQKLNDQTLKTTMAEVVSQALSTEVGPLVEASVKKLPLVMNLLLLMPTV